MSFSVMAGSVGRAYVTLMPLFGSSGPGERARATTRSSLTRLGHEPRHAVADDDLRAIGDETAEVVEGDAHASGSEHVAVAAEARPGRPARAGARRVSPARRSFGPCRSNSRVTGRPARSAASRSSMRAAAQVVGRPVRAVDARAVHARCDELVEHPGPIGGRPQRGDDLGAAVVHALECGTGPAGRRQAWCLQRLSERVVRALVEQPEARLADARVTQHLLPRRSAIAIGAARSTGKPYAPVEIDGSATTGQCDESASVIVRAVDRLQQLRPRRGRRPATPGRRRG